MTAMRLVAAISVPFALGVGIMAISPKLAPFLFERVLGNKVLGTSLLGAALLTLGIGILLQDKVGLRASRRSWPPIVFTLIGFACFLFGITITSLWCDANTLAMLTASLAGFFLVIAAIIGYFFRQAAIDGGKLFSVDTQLAEKTRRLIFGGLIMIAGFVNFYLAFRAFPTCCS